MLVLGRYGFKIKNDLGFTIDRPRRSGEFLFIRFRTPVYIQLANVKSVTDPGSWILFTPEFPHRFHSPDSPVITDWFYFFGKDNAAIKRLLERLSIPLNQLNASRKGSDVMGKAFEALCQNTLLSDLEGEVWRSGWLLQFLANLPTSGAHKGKLPTRMVNRQTLEQLQYIRTVLYQTPEAKWSVSEMAQRASLSTSRFSAVYKAAFRVSPGRDLIKARVEKARYLLTNQSLSVKQVAEMAGYESECHFIRQFKTETGTTPGHFALET
ncbi:AraC family transcriptional regulator of arabinose operon [Paenibacillus rhizosphaerae]|uniref:AraC family transcriptional regulator of arabinose operon n=1 Tax=Paenibacillus rhizosphaerae TaxID=297318 RepID=A0A839TJT8_9BACL|nr:AraC family transcriptional regulator [Paenibacillus rhizosphaerae]MBB3127044.1 AraC family transcriptional regulator of arabinose operon [Paenibacillus rhizosphaerae]